MVKYRAAPKGYDAGSVITTKSPYGSHTDMVVELEELQSAGIDTFGMDAISDLNMVVCKDDKGYYITHKDRLDNGLADPARYAVGRNEGD
jgi:hypothetical protein